MQKNLNLNNQEKTPLNKLEGVVTYRKIDVKELTYNLKVIVPYRNNKVIGVFKKLLKTNNLVVIKTKDEQTSTNIEILVEADKLEEIIISDVKTTKKYPIARSQWFHILENKLIHSIQPYFINEYLYENNVSQIRAKLSFTEKPSTQIIIEKKEIINIIHTLERSKDEKSKDLAFKLRQHYKIFGRETAIKKRIDGQTYSNKT